MSSRISAFFFYIFATCSLHLLEDARPRPPPPALRWIADGPLPLRRRRIPRRRPHRRCASRRNHYRFSLRCPRRKLVRQQRPTWEPATSTSATPAPAASSSWVSSLESAFCSCCHRRHVIFGFRCCLSLLLLLGFVGFRDPVVVPSCGSQRPGSKGWVPTPVGWQSPSLRCYRRYRTCWSLLLLLLSGPVCFSFLSSTTAMCASCTSMALASSNSAFSSSSTGASTGTSCKRRAPPPWSAPRTRRGNPARRSPPAAVGAGRRRGSGRRRCRHGYPPPPPPMPPPPRPAPGGDRRNDDKVGTH